MLTIVLCLVVVLGLRSRLDLVPDGWLVIVVHTYLSYFPLSLSSCQFTAC